MLEENFFYKSCLVSSKEYKTGFSKQEMELSSGHSKMARKSDGINWLCDSTGSIRSPELPKQIQPPTMLLNHTSLAIK